MEAFALILGLEDQFVDRSGPYGRCGSLQARSRTGLQESSLI